MAANRDSKALLSLLNNLPEAESYWVAYSGGVDSHVLLYMLANTREQLGASIGAVHIDHQLQPDSEIWTEHCQTVCDQLDIPFASLKVNAAAGRGESPEATARTARYQALKDWLPQGAALLTAQHQDDQAETLLLQLMRGAGSKGLAGMPAVTEFGGGLLVRPLLGISRESILAYARQHQLKWIEDPSNEDHRFDRNFLRHNVLPHLRKRWPSLSATLGRAARHQADQTELNAALGEIDLAQSVRGSGLCINRLSAHTQARQRNLLRYWINRQGLPIPPDKILQRVLDECLTSQSDSNPLVHWSGAEVRRYRDRLFVMPALSSVTYDQHYEWQLEQPLELKNPDGVLSVTLQTGKGLHRRFEQQALEVRLRRGGEVVQPALRGQTHALKKLLQETGIPVWERERLPLLYVDDALVAVPGICICEGYQAGQGEPGYFPNWSRLEAYL